MGSEIDHHIKGLRDNNPTLIQALQAYGDIQQQLQEKRELFQERVTIVSGQLQQFKSNNCGTKD